jgi:hypothetical protein
MSGEKNDDLPPGFVDVDPMTGEPTSPDLHKQVEAEALRWERMDGEDKYAALRRKYPHYGRALVIGGDGEPEIPFPVGFGRLTEEEKKLVFKHDDPMYHAPDHPKNPTMSFPLQAFASDIDRRGIAELLPRRKRQLENARLRLQAEPRSFVLMTGSYANCQARNIWGILWVYLVHKFISWWKSKKEPS